MKLTHLAAFLSIAVPGFSAVPGSYGAITSTLTITDYVTAPAVVLKNGNSETRATRTTYKLTNAAILAEAQRQGLIPAGSLTGWRIYAVFDENTLSGFLASNGTIHRGLADVITFYTPTQGFATGGKWVETPEGAVVSGATSYKLGFDFKADVNEIAYNAKVVTTISDAVVTLKSGKKFWRPAAFKISIQGTSNEDNSVMEGALSVGAAKAVDDLESVFPGVDFGS